MAKALEILLMKRGLFHGQQFAGAHAARGSVRGAADERDGIGAHLDPDLLRRWFGAGRETAHKEVGRQILQLAAFVHGAELQLLEKLGWKIEGGLYGRKFAGFLVFCQTGNAG